MTRKLMVQPVAQLLAGLEEWDVLFADRDAVAGARVAANASVALLDRERPKAAQLDPITARQRRGDLVKNRGDDDLDIALIEMRVAFRKPLDEFRFRHGGSQLPSALLGFPTVPKPCASVKQT